VKLRLLKILGFALIIPVIAIATLVAAAEYHEWRHVRPWREVRRGDSQERVMQLLGRPDDMQGWQSDRASWESGRKTDVYDAEVVERFRYIHWSPLSGDEYYVGFDRKGHATAKYHERFP